jgi:hypothetical protein
MARAHSAPISSALCGFANVINQELQFGPFGGEQSFAMEL